MEAGSLFRVKGRSEVYKAVAATEGCGGCCAYAKQRLCNKMPYCFEVGFIFLELTTYAVRKAKKENTFIDYFES